MWIWHKCTNKCTAVLEENSEYGKYSYYVTSSHRKKTIDKAHYIKNNFNEK
jgi:hypothetical protein